LGATAIAPVCGGRCKPVIRGWRASGAGGQRGQAVEGAHDGGRPGPVGGQVQGAAAGVAGQLGGDVPQAVAQALGLGDGVLAVEQ